MKVRPYSIVNFKYFVNLNSEIILSDQSFLKLHNSNENEKTTDFNGNDVYIEPLFFYDHFFRRKNGIGLLRDFCCGDSVISERQSFFVHSFEKLPIVGNEEDVVRKVGEFDGFKLVVAFEGMKNSHN